MKNNKFMAAVLATQVGLCSILSPSTFARSRERKPGVIRTVMLRTVDLAYDLAELVLQSGVAVVASAITGELGAAVRNDISYKDHYSKHALDQAGITDVDVERYEEKADGDLLFHVWCEKTYEIKPVKVIGFDYPGLYEYKDHYYVLIGNYGVNLGTIKEKAVDAFKIAWAKTKTVAGNTKDFCVDKSKKIYKALTRDDNDNDNENTNNS